MTGLLVATVALRLEGIGTWYWVDEALSVGIARHPMTDIPHLLLRDGSPPLWYLLLHVWTSVFGTSVVATHAMSTVFGVAAVPVAWMVARRLFDDRAAWFSAAVVALSPFVTYFAHETRMYSLVVVLTVLVCWSFVAAFVDDREGAGWWFAAAMLALLYTHNWGLYTGVASVVALGVIAVARREWRPLLRRALPAYAVVAVGFLPWLPSLVAQIHNTGAPWSFTPSIRQVVRELAALFRDERILVALLLAAGAGLSPLVRRWRSRDALVIWTLITFAAIPVVLGWGLAHVEPSWATRYLAVVVAPIVLVVGVGLARARGIGLAALALAAILILQPLTRVDGLPLPRDAKSNARRIAQIEGPRLRAGDLAIVAQPEAVPLLRMELGPGLRYADPTGPSPDPTVMDWRNAERRLRAASFDRDLRPVLDQLAIGRRVLLVTAANRAKSTDTPWIRLFRAQGLRIEVALRADRRFRLVGRVGGERSSYVNLDAAVYERVAAS